MSDLEQAIRAAAKESVQNEAERHTAMLNSIEAVHGPVVRDAVCAAFQLHKATMPLVRVLGMSDLPPDHINLFLANLNRRSALVNIALFHTALGAKIPSDTAGGMDFDPRAQALNKMFQAMVATHQRETEAIGKKVSDILQKAGE